MDAFIQDLRYAARTLRRAPVVSSLAIICLALGIGANATMFSVVHSTLVQPLPFAEPERLVDVWTLDPAGSDRNAVSYPDLRDWTRETRSFEALSDRAGQAAYPILAARTLAHQAQADLDNLADPEHVLELTQRARQKLGSRSSPGIHDTIIAACDRYRYKFLGFEGYHDNCTDNLFAGMKELGLTPPECPSPFNVWMNIPVAKDGGIQFLPTVSKPGDELVLRAEMDLIIAFSAAAEGGSSSPEEIKPMISAVVNGMYVSLYATLLGIAVNLWLKINLRLLGNFHG